MSGYDIGPGNILMDVWASKHNHGNYDNNGNWAKGGKINMGLLNSFKSDPFFKKKPPKSTGTDYFNLQWITDHCRQNTPDNLSPRDIQSTLLELTTSTIIDAIKAWPQSELALCGGGVKNKTYDSYAKKKNCKYHFTQLLIGVSTQNGLKRQALRTSRNKELKIKDPT